MRRKRHWRKPRRCRRTGKIRYRDLLGAKNLDGVKILQGKPEDYDDAQLIVDDLYKEWKKEDVKRHE